MVHNNKRPNECDLCDKKFFNKSDLTKHIQFMHNMERNEECTYCGKKFGEKGDLKRHILTHEKMKNSVDSKLRENETKLGSNI